jgi:hypothetical protein
MLQPKNNINKVNQKNVRFDIKPVITKLNDVIQQNTFTAINQFNNLNNIHAEQIVNNSQINSHTNDNYSSSSEKSTYSTELIETSSSSEFSEFSKSSESSETSETSDNPSETKLYWEYGNTGLKITNFNKKMSRNLTIMNYIDILFSEYIDMDLTDSYQKLFSSSTNKNYNLKTGLITAKNGIVTAKLTQPKLTGTYNIIEAGFINISDIKLSEKDLKQNSIPNLEQILTHKENIYHITKIIKLFKLKKLMTIKSNISIKNNSFEQMTQNANDFFNELIKNDKKNKILKSNKNSGLYIKIYNSHAKGFIIDGINDIIYYIAVNINFKIGNINLRYYALNIKNGRIIVFK